MRHLQEWTREQPSRSREESGVRWTMQKTDTPSEDCGGLALSGEGFLEEETPAEARNVDKLPRTANS